MQEKQLQVHSDWKSSFVLINLHNFFFSFSFKQQDVLITKPGSSSISFLCLSQWFGDICAISCTQISKLYEILKKKKRWTNYGKQNFDTPRKSLKTWSKPLQSQSKYWYTLRMWWKIMPKIQWLYINRYYHFFGHSDLALIPNLRKMQKN